MTGDPEAWAFVVGINHYPPSTGQRPLQGAVADAVDFADWALDPAGGNVLPERLFFWTHPAPTIFPPAVLAYIEAGPTAWWDPRVNPLTPDFQNPPFAFNIVETALATARQARARALVEGAESPRRCYVFFAGHGVQTNVVGMKEKQTCFVVGDFMPNASVAMGLVPCNEFRDTLLGAGFDEVVMFLDCCRTEVARLDMPAPGLQTAAIQAPPQPVYIVGSAAQMGRPAYETNAPPIRGAFSKTLVHALRTVRGPNGELEYESLRSYVNANISLHTPKEQRPSFVGEPNNPWPPVLRGRMPLAPLPGGVQSPGSDDRSPSVAVVPLGLPTAAIRISFGGLPADATVQIVDGFAQLICSTFRPQTGTFVVQAPVDGHYSVEVVGTEIRKLFKLGAGGQDVTL
jgi:hypothetical protein